MREDPFVITDNNGVTLMRLVHWDRFGVQASYSTRKGGISTSAYASLNLGLHTGDDPEKVLVNRQRWVEAQGLSLADIVVGQQVHGNQVIAVGERERERGARNKEDALPSTDGLTTLSRRVALVAFFADCIPVFIFDPVSRAVALVHAGWRGTVGNIVGAALDVMKKTWRTNPGDCLAATGPGIQPCCYEVGLEVTDQIKNLFPGGGGTLCGDGVKHLDLPLANTLLLKAKGVPRENIAISRWCTSCRSELFYSYRRDGPVTGRMGALMVLE